jgi:hypothetical protein
MPTPAITLILAATMLFLAGPSWAQFAPDHRPPDHRPDERGKTMVVMDVELDGDLADPSRVDDWRRRLAEINATLRQSIAQAGYYTVVDATPAADLLAQYRHRKAVHECVPCLRDVAQRLGAERVLTAWVFRMSNLVLALHAIVWAPATDEVIMTRTLQFRGDTDYAWRRATDYLLNDIGEMEKPPQM